MDLLLRILSNADIGDHMCHMISDLGLAKFQLPLMSNYKSLCYDPPSSGILAFSRQLNQSINKESINPHTICQAGWYLTIHFSFIQAKMSFIPIQPLGSPGEDIHWDIAHHSIIQLLI